MPLRTCLCLAAILVSAPAAAQTSQWAHPGPDGKLVYGKTERGDRIPDFSTCGYHSGGVALPAAAARVKLSPSGGDDTAAIQSELDKGGVVEFAAGMFRLAETLHVRVSGAVLRGAGSSEKNGTVIELTGTPHLAIDIRGEFHQRTLPGATTIEDAYVPSGANAIHVKDAAAIKPGDMLLIAKPVTPDWVRFMGMDHLIRDGKAETWVRGELTVRRRVAAVNGNAVTLETPLTDSFDSKFFAGAEATVTRVEISGQISEIGIEHLRITAPARQVNFQQDKEFDGIHMDSLADSWFRDLALENITGSVSIGRNAERITVTEVDTSQKFGVTSAAKPADFAVNGSQILLDRCTGHGDKVFYIVTQAGSEGPVAAINCRFTGDGAIEPHQRWSTGLLVDSCEAPEIDYMNRGEMGSGHGWTIGWSVSWNNKAGGFVMQNPPGALNWSIGDVGQQKTAPMPVFGSPKGGPAMPRGVVDSPGKHVAPASLYLQQLRDRLGEAAVENLGRR